MTTENTNSVDTNPTTIAAYQALIESLRAQNEALVKANTLDGGIKVSEKGGVSVYGLGRFPVTLYREQWLKLFAKVEAIKAFITENEKLLSVKAPRATK